VNYDTKKLTLSEDELKLIVRNAVFSYNSTNLGNFNSAFRLSSLFSTIVNSHSSILGCDMKVTVEKRTTINLGVNQTYTIPFGLELARGGLNDRVHSPTSFEIFDNTGVVRVAYLEEVPLSSSGISDIEVRSPGSNYTSQASVTISGDAPSGSEATAHPIIVNGQVRSIVIDKQGGGYSFAEATVVDTKGFGAVAYPILSSLVGQLRIVYFQNSEKIVLNDNAGVIRYDTGEITLTNFNPVSTIGETVGEIVMIAQSENDTIMPTRNNIIVIDANDENSVVIDLVAE
jgi:hypothetical protein